MMGRASQVRGSIGQTAAAWHLQRLGVRCLQEIATPVITTNRGKMRIVIGYKNKVCGDFMGIMPNGRGVLVEVKSYDVEKLPWGALEPHQRSHLYDHAQCGGLSLICWHNRSAPMNNNCAVFPFGAAPGWGIGNPLPWDTALKVAITREQIDAQ